MTNLVLKIGLIALNWAPEGKRKKGCQRETWKRTVEKERSQMGFKCGQRQREQL